MKAESNVKPAQFEIIPINDDEVEVLLYENIETLPPAENEEVEKYSYDYYRLIVRNRENLKTAIEASFEAWKQLAKEKELSESISIPSIGCRLSILEDTVNFVLGL